MIEFRDQLGLWRALQQYRVEGRLYTLRACSSVTVLGHNSETVVRGGDGVMDWFEVTVARERSKTVSMQCSAAVQGGGMLNNCQVYKVSQNVEEQHEAVKVNWSNSNTMVFNMQGFFGVQHSD